MTETKTHWKKNIDTRYIAGEDLKAGLKGLRNEMAVVIDRFTDTPTFDQKQNKELTATGLFLKELNGVELYKPVILNKTNARFLAEEFKSEFMEDWLNKPIVIYAQVDKRHGHVVRFKKYYAPKKATPDAAIKLLTACTTLEELANVWGTLSLEEKSLPEVLAKKDEKKGELGK